MLPVHLASGQGGNNLFHLGHERDMANMDDPGITSCDIIPDPTIPQPRVSFRLRIHLGQLDAQRIVTRRARVIQHGAADPDRPMLRRLPIKLVPLEPAVDQPLLSYPGSVQGFYTSS